MVVGAATGSLAGVVLLLGLGIHTVRQGNVGVYYRGGALRDNISDPGYHWRVPLLDRVAEIQTSMQTDAIENVPCGTSGGVMIQFDKIEGGHAAATRHHAPPLTPCRRSCQPVGAPWGGLAPALPPHRTPQAGS